MWVGKMRIVLSFIMYKMRFLHLCAIYIIKIYIHIGKVAKKCPNFAIYMQIWGQI